MELYSEHTLPSTGENFNSPVACHLIVFLWYLGCDIESIIRVIHAHGLGGTISDVARHIEERGLSGYDFGSYPDGRRTYTKATGDQIMIEFADGRPIRYVLRSDRITTIFPREIVTANTPDGRKILTIIIQGQIRCCVWDGEDFLPAWSDRP